MAKQREKVEFRYYEIPENELVLALLGEEWIREYGKGIDYLHFHNHMEIGCCHWGEGEVVRGQERLPFSLHSIMIVPPKLPHTTNSRKGTMAYWEWLYVDMEKFILAIHREDPMFHKNLLKRIQRTGYLLAGELLYSCVVEFLRLSDDEEQVMRTRTKSAMIANALDYVAGSYREEIKISSLADACGMSESHFRRVFSEGMNMKPGITSIWSGCRMPVSC